MDPRLRGDDVLSKSARSLRFRKDARHTPVMPAQAGISRPRY